MLQSFIRADQSYSVMIKKTDMCTNTCADICKDTKNIGLFQQTGDSLSLPSENIAASHNLETKDKLITINQYIRTKYADVLDKILLDDNDPEIKSVFSEREAFSTISIIPSSRNVSESTYWDDTYDYSDNAEYISGVFKYSADIIGGNGKTVKLQKYISLSIEITVPINVQQKAISPTNTFHNTSPNISNTYDIFSNGSAKWNFIFLPCTDPESLYKESPKEERVYLDQYLVAKRKPWEIAEVCEGIMYRLFPNEMETMKVVCPYDIAAVLGLSIMHLKLDGMDSTRSLLVQKKQTFPIRVSGSSKPQMQTVPANTIVINTSNGKYRSCEEFYIAHECWHHVGQLRFSMLQREARREFSKMTFGELSISRTKTYSAAIPSLENEANIAANFLCFPQSIAEHEADILLSQQNSRYNEGQKWENVIMELSKTHGLSKGMVRRVFTYTGHTAAKGACNYVNGSYIKPFAFSKGHCVNGRTFVISMEETMKCYAANPDFREAVNDGVLVWADGHMCINTTEYIYGKWVYTYVAVEGKLKETKVLRYFLTEEALAHIDKCCLEFCRSYGNQRKQEGIGKTNSNFYSHSASSYNQDTYNAYVYGILSCDSKQFASIRSRAYVSAKNAPGRRLIASAYENLARQSALPSSFSKTLETHRKQNGMTREELAGLSDISDRTIQRIENGETLRISIETVLRLTIALHLKGALAQDFFAKAGYEIKQTLEGNALRFMLANIEGITLQDVKEFINAYDILKKAKSREEANSMFTNYEATQKNSDIEE